jgi:hypothetical protein
VTSQETYFPPSELEGGWRVADPPALGIDGDRLREAINYHDSHVLTTSYGGAILVVYKGHIVAESYTTGEEADHNLGPLNRAMT